MEAQAIQEEENIAIYPQRSQVFKWLFPLAVVDGVIVYGFFQLIPILALLLHNQAAYLPWIALVDFLYALGIGAILLVLPYICWTNFIVLRNWVSPQCVFVINRQGFLIHRQPFIKSAFLPWNTIAEIAFMRASAFQGSHLFLSLRNTKSLFSHRFQRICWRWFSGHWIGHHPANVLAVGPWFLTMSEEELASHIQRVFHQELRV
jgi:hypothetical protein